MNKCASKILALVFILSASQAAYAQTNHSVQSLNPGLRWTVEIAPPSRKLSNSNKQEPASPVIQKRLLEENVMGHDLRKQTTFSPTGEPFSRYALGDMVLYISKQTRQIEIEPSSYELPGGSLSAKRFTEFFWIGERTYRGVENLGDRPCDVYRRPWSYRALEDIPAPEGESTQPPPAAADSTFEIVAYIDKKTRLPVRLETPEETRIYTFSPNPNPVVLPADFQKEWDDRLVRIEKRKNRFKIPQ